MTTARRLPSSSNPLFFTSPTRRLLGAGFLFAAAGAAPACITPSVTGSAGGAGGVGTSSSTGLDSVSSVTSTSGGGGVTVTTSATSAGGAGGAPASTSSSSASVGGAGGAASSSSSGSGGADPLDCTFAGFSGGDLVWTADRPHPGPDSQFPGNPKGWHLDNVLAGSTGRVFVAISYFVFQMAGVSPGGAVLDELDSQGAYLGTRGITGTGGGFDVRTSIFGPRHHAFAVLIPHAAGVYDQRIEGDAVSLAWHKDDSEPFDYVGAVMGNADGELFASFGGVASGPLISSWAFPWGVEQGNLIVKWNSSGGHAFTKNILASPTFVTPGNSGDVFVGGSLVPGVDLGCGPIAGSGPYYVARLDTTGQCLWSHAIVGVTTAAGSLQALGSAADGSVILVNSSFKGTEDVGCGPMTSAPGGSSFAAKLDASGACVWSKSFDVQHLLPSLFPSGELLLSTLFTGTVDLGGGPLTSAGVQDVALARLDASGAAVWSKSFGGAGASLCAGAPCYNAVADANGSVLLSGVLTGWVDFGGGPLGSMAAQSYTVKMDGAGGFLWQHQLPDRTFVTPDPCGAVLCAHENGDLVTVDKLAP